MELILFEWVAGIAMLVFFGCIGYVCMCNFIENAKQYFRNRGK